MISKLAGASAFLFDRLGTGLTAEESLPASAAILSVSKSRLEGEVSISGAKNSALPMMAASLLTSEPVVLSNYPAKLLDVAVQLEMLCALGKSCAVDGTCVTISESLPPSSTLSWPGRSIRNTLLVLGALVARTGEGAVPLPGGCRIGDRKFDLHEMVLRQLGAEVWIERDALCAAAPSGLAGADIVLPIRSTGATENAIICATLARGETRVWNPHMRPEIYDLINLLRAMGAQIETFGQESIRVTGRESLRGARHQIIPDNLEAITWLIASVLTGGDIAIHNFPSEHLEVPLIFLRESGARFEIVRESARVRAGRCLPLDISTGPYPGINSDMQPLFSAFAACANGQSRVTDLRFPDRYGYIEEFRKMGVRCEIRAGALQIYGGAPVRGADVRAVDLRAGMALVLLGLTATGETRIRDAWQIDRGYQDLEQKLRNLNAVVALKPADAEHRSM